ncbi:hypothetical protein ACHQM5_029318 [Ranunculus cassubicifolius]
MKEEQDLQFPQHNHHQNGRSFLPAQPVTVAAASPHRILTLALPIQQPRPPPTAAAIGVGAGGGTIQPPRPPPNGGGSGGGGSGGGGGREDCWSEAATSILIDAWGERYLELSRGNLKQNHWRDVADIVSIGEDTTYKPAKTDVQCKNRIDTLKKKYKIEKAKIASGEGPSKWIFFDRIDQLIGANTKISASAAPFTGIPVNGSGRILRNRHQHSQQQQNRQHIMNSKSSGEAPPSPDSTDSLPPETSNRKRPHYEAKVKIDLKWKSNPPPKKKVKGKGWGNSMRELSRAIQEFGQAYERTESSKLQQMVEIEKQRMGLAKDLELKRMQFFMETQMELSNKYHNNTNK